MERPIDLEQAVRDFAGHMRRYGYRNRFTISLGKGKDFTANLNDCLNRYLAANLRADSYPFFELRTNAPYSDLIECRFRIEFNTTAGFQMHNMWVRDSKSKIEHQYRLSSNRELPGAQTLCGLFPKPRPWDFLKKGKFRL